MKFIFVVIASVALMFSVGCAANNIPGAQVGQNAISGQAKDVTLEMFNFGFKQVGQIQRGDSVRLHVKSTQGTHSIAIPDLGLASKPIS